MEDYVLEFEKLYNRIYQKEMTLPPAVLAFKLLDGAKLNHCDCQLVLTGIYYTNRETLFEQMKKAFHKFHGKQVIPSSSDLPAAIKVETALSNEQEAYYSKMSQYRKYNQNYSQQFRQPQLSNQQYYKPMPYHPNTQNQSEKQSYTPKPEPQTNPKGFNKKPLKCNISESVLHLMRDCPHKNHPNGANIILYTGTRKTEACLLTSEARNSAMLDSGCTSTVAGKLWIDCYLQSLSNDDLSQVVWEESNKIFKFGGGETKQSMETIYNNSVCTCREAYIY